MSDGIRLDPTSLQQLDRLAAAYKRADKPLQKGIRDGLRAAAKPLGEEIIRAGAAVMPARGGLRARVAAARGTVSLSLSGSRQMVSIRPTNRQKDYLRGLDDGQIRHPVFGNRKTWVGQRVPAHAFTDAFNRGAPEARDRLRRAMQAALDDIAREA